MVLYQPAPLGGGEAVGSAQLTLLSLERGRLRTQEPTSPFWMCQLLVLKIPLLLHSGHYCQAAANVFGCLMVLSRGYVPTCGFAGSVFQPLTISLMLGWVSSAAVLFLCPVPLEVQRPVQKTVGLAGFLTPFLPSCGSAAMHRRIIYREPSLMTPRAVFKSH